MTINQKITIKASAKNVYNALTNAAEFSEVTATPAHISDSEGGAFSCFGGQISGRHIELKPHSRIVQAWRVGSWEDGVYSIVRFEISQSGDECILTLDHSAYPDDAGEHLQSGWYKMYWEPLKAYLE